MGHYRWQISIHHHHICKAFYDVSVSLTFYNSLSKCDFADSFFSILFISPNIKFSCSMCHVAEFPSFLRRNEVLTWMCAQVHISCFLYSCRQASSFYFLAIVSKGASSMEAKLFLQSNFVFFVFVIIPSLTAGYTLVKVSSCNFIIVWI